MYAKCLQLERRLVSEIVGVGREIHILQCVVRLMNGSSFGE
jgi:hypothetical protein